MIGKKAGIFKLLSRDLSGDAAPNWGYLSRQMLALGGTPIQVTLRLK